MFFSRFYIVFFVIIYIKENIIDGEEFLKIGKFYLVRNLVSLFKVYSLKLKFFIIGNIFYYNIRKKRFWKMVILDFCIIFIKVFFVLG